MKKVIIITGPTASGKTKLALKIAEEYNTTLINGDAFQAYKGLDILTAKPSIKEREKVKHFLMDELDPFESFSIYDYQKRVRTLIDHTQLPIIIGGSGLYIDSVIYNYQFSDQQYEFDDSKYSNEELKAILLKLDSETALKIPTNNRRRLIRQIQLFHMQSKESRKQKGELLYDALIIVLNPNREKLYEKINLRVKQMIDVGLIEEIKNHPNLLNTQLGKAIGYLDIYKYLNNEQTLEEAINQIQTKSRHYAKRQLTWYRNHPHAQFIDYDLDNIDELFNHVKSLIDNFLNK